MNAGDTEHHPLQLSACTPANLWMLPATVTTLP